MTAFPDRRAGSDCRRGAIERLMHALTDRDEPLLVTIITPTGGMETFHIPPPCSPSAAASVSPSVDEETPVPGSIRLPVREVKAPGRHQEFGCRKRVLCVLEDAGRRLVIREIMEEFARL